MNNNRTYLQSLLGIDDEIEAQLREEYRNHSAIGNSQKEIIKKSKSNSNELSLSTSDDHVKMGLFLRKETRDRLHIHKINSGENISNIVDAAVNAYLDDME